MYVYTKLNHHILQFSDLKCTYEIEPLQIECNILQSSNVIFSKCDRFFNHICIVIKFHNKQSSLATVPRLFSTLNYHERLGPLCQFIFLSNKHKQERQSCVCVVLKIAVFKSQCKPRALLLSKTIPLVKEWDVVCFYFLY